MCKILCSHNDFKFEKTRVEHFLHQKGHRVLFIPKYHCELNPIERVWGEAKRFTRKHCNYTFPQLEPAFDSVNVQLIRKYFRKAREYMIAYRERYSAGLELVEAIKCYKSHRRVLTNK